MRNGVASKIFRNKTIKRIDDKIKLLGVNNELDTATFLSLRLILCVSIFIILLIFSKYGYIMAPICTISFYYIFELIIIDNNIKKRAIKLENEALFFFEVLALTLESGRSLKHSIELTTNDISSLISLEFKQALKEVKMGKSLNESLEAMKKRIPSDAINNIIINMIGSNTLGTNIITSIYNQIDFLRTKQLLNVKAEITKLPTKISVISVIFFIPLMLLIILAPILIEFLLT